MTSADSTALRAPSRLDEAESQPGSAASLRKQARERKQKLRRGARRVIVGALLVGATAAAVAALRPRPVPIDVARATRKPLVVAVEESGMTRVLDRYVVSAPVAGRVSRLAFDPGAAIHEGDTLAEIAPADSPLLDARTRAEAEARLAAALSALGQAHALSTRAEAAKGLSDGELARTRALAHAGSVAPQTLDQAVFAAQIQAAEASSARFAEKVAAEDVRVARVTLGRGDGSVRRDRHIDVQSPVSGSVLRVHQKSAGVVAAGAPLVEVGDPHALEVVVDLLTTDAVRVAPGTSVAIDGWGGDHPLTGRVRLVEPSAFTRPSALGVDEQRVNVVIALTDPPESWAALGDGYRVEARLVLWKGDDVLTVPHGAVFRHGGGWAAFRVEDGVARLEPVTIGHRADTEVEITSGLSPSSVVAVHPGDRVKDGVRVEAR